MTRAPALCLAAVLAVTVTRPAWARVVAMPEGGKPVLVVRDGIVCGPVSEGWALEPDRRSIRPPAPDSGAAHTVEVRVASDLAACERSKDVVTLLATGPFPTIDIGSVLFAPDEGRVELRGQGLKGVQVVWQAGERSGKEVCLEPSAVGTGKVQQCVIPLPPGLPFETSLTWLPPGAVMGEEVSLHDANGSRVSPSDLALRPARVLINQVLPSSSTVDVSQGPGRVPLSHPPAVVGVDCGLARCEIADRTVVVRTVPAAATNVTMRLRLAPRVFFVRGDVQETSVQATLPLVQCPLGIVTGPPLREADDAQVIVRMDPRCAKERDRARWYVGGEIAEVVGRPKVVNEAAFVQLRVGRLLGDKVTITAHRPDLDATIIGSVTARTIPAPRPRVTLELPKHGKVEFIPTNRPAVLSVAGAGPKARLVPVPVEGAYSVRFDKGQYLIRGDENAGGFVALRFGYRAEGLPPEVGNPDLAVVNERVQRAVREASVPAPFSTTADSPEPLVELVCSSGKDQKPVRVPPGKLFKLPFEARDSCKVIIHRERLSPEYGLQEVILDVEVTRPDGTRRADASFRETMILVPGGDTRVIPLKGGTEEFDRLLVRVSHVLDETRYALSPTSRQGLPAVQWSLMNEGGRVRLYASAAIPAGLYRINKPSGQLTLNFGVLSRLTWLDERGKEGLLGAEIGLMGMGLIQRPGAIEYPLTIGAVAGFGIRVPLGSGAAVGVHIWGAYEFRESFDYKVNPKMPGDCITADNPMPTRVASCKAAGRFAVIFGPSITIGNVGTNL